MPKETSSGVGRTSKRVAGVTRASRGVSAKYASRAEFAEWRSHGTKEHSETAGREAIETSGKAGEVAGGNARSFAFYSS